MELYVSLTNSNFLWTWDLCSLCCVPCTFCGDAFGIDGLVQRKSSGVSGDKQAGAGTSMRAGEPADFHVGWELLQSRWVVLRNEIGKSFLT